MADARRGESGNPGMRIAAVVTQFMKVRLVRPIQSVHCVLAGMSARRFT
jgi:hypothetical protein